MKSIILLITSAFFVTCQGPIKLSKDLDIQGHRGCRGLLPENTIPGFIKAIDLGVTTLEMDVVISKDSQIVVSHEPFFNHEISTGPNGFEINEENEKQFNLFEMTVAEIQNYDVGLKNHPRFPEQLKVKANKPTLREVVDAVNQHLTSINKSHIFYNIEIKYNPLGRSFHPDVETYSKLVYDEIERLGIKNQTTIQSFSPECLNIVFGLDKEISLALLVENKESYRINLDKLNFKPKIYSPDYKLVDKLLIDYCNQNSIKLIPWTVNDENDIKSLIEKGVDGIISDFPDRVIKIYSLLKSSN